MGLLLESKKQFSLLGFAVEMIVARCADTIGRVFRNVPSNCSIQRRKQRPTRFPLPSVAPGTPKLARPIEEVLPAVCNFGQSEIGKGRIANILLCPRVLLPFVYKPRDDLRPIGWNRQGAFPPHGIQFYTKYATHPAPGQFPKGISDLGIGGKLPNSATLGIPGSTLPA